ncbi:hypothetical protein F751_6803 [Auxenochlorella protothecoides]|uniref:Uncharacterized protein n=1 Tax=Auxenochlorella protothecoides TaxID=3075 RepID=A0A087SDN1_AUXPR|nr:hypothetical protein F751_6803 [Auxenochlorella protothecoides]KFM23835.1 hypothetical protein F751_6803 [Auxenochlorella protothecoides]
MRRGSCKGTRQAHEGSGSRFLSANPRGNRPCPRCLLGGTAWQLHTTTQMPSPHPK